ncbi:MAG: insulinase family protein [Rhodospirillales bacterium]|nr:insulinase family protein [Rhodospirillales bacterium]
MTGIRVSTLKNGLRVASDAMDSVETISVGVWIEAGSRYESSSISGISHFLEHMVFKGTRRRNARAIAEEIEAVGGHLNAHTSREYTAFYAKILKENLSLAIDIIADILQDATLDNGELGRERTVILQEIMQAQDTPDDIIFDRFQETAFPQQALGRPVLGSPDRIEAMTRDVLQGYMREHYGAPRMILSAAGRVDHDTLVALAEKAFDRLPHAVGAEREPARYRGGDYREERDLEQVHIVLGFEGLNYRDPDYYALSVLSTLLGGGMSSRLFQEAREKRGLVYSIYSFPSSYSDTGVFGIYAGTGEEEAEKLLPLVCEELGKLAKEIGEAEIDRARAQLRAGMLMSLESTSARCEQLARQLMVFGRSVPIAESVERIAAVDRSAVVRTAERILVSPPTLATIGPIKRLAAYSELTSWLAQPVTAALNG